DLDLVPVELDPQHAGAARVLRAADQVVVEPAAAQPRRDLAAERLAEVLAGAPDETGVGEQVAEHRRAGPRSRADEEGAIDARGLDPPTQRRHVRDEPDKRDSRRTSHAPDSRLRPVARIAFNMQPVEHPWGGGNSWLVQVVRHLRESGYELGFDLSGSPDCIVLVDPRVGGNVTFGHAEIAEHRQRYPAARCLHRVNECDLRKGTSEIDSLLAQANQVADHTVFISGWLRDYHAERWYDAARPHWVVLNGADPAIFNPVGSEELEPGGTMRI